jgi:acetyl esterase/lipase
VYIYLHSGGYVAYTIDTADPGCRVIAGCVIVSVGYRLAPEAGVEVEYVEFPRMIHNFNGMGGAIDIASDGLGCVAAALRQAFAEA